MHETLVVDLEAREHEVWVLPRGELDLHTTEELEQALTFPWEKWIFFLHPSQRELVERDFNGPARVMGSAGTGKTVVALHRAVRLAARGPDTLLATEPILDDDRRDRSVEVVLQPRPHWWPTVEGGGAALAFWRGGVAAKRWMADIANK